MNSFSPRSLAFLVACSFSVAASGQAIAEEAPGVSKAGKVIAVWPSDPPEWDAPDGEEHDSSKENSRGVAGKSVVRLANVSKPEIHLYPAINGQGKSSDTVVVICPGGGYSILAWDLEGTEIATQLQASGVTAAVLKYRVPTRDMEPKWVPPVQDIQRTIAIVRAGKVTGHTPKHVGVLGFSAGGNASARTATAKQRHYDSVDEADKEIRQPDFACLVYPAWLVEKEAPTTLSEGIVVDKDTPPMFFAHAENDPHSVDNSVTMFQKLRAAGVPSSLHVFTGSGHGFGGRVDNRADDLWPTLFVMWLRDAGFMANNPSDSGHGDLKKDGSETSRP